MAKVIEQFPYRYDLNKDGEVTDEEMARATQMLELELKEEKADAQRKMAWTSIASMIIFTIVLFTPILKDTRVAALADLLGLFYIANASIVGFYFGAQAYMNKK